MRSRHHCRNELLDDLKRLGLCPRRGHDMRRTFITLARADGARADLLKMVTHDQKKDIINIYTSMPWAPLCEEVAKLRVQRRTGQLFVLPKAASGEDEPQLATFDDAPDATRTSAGTSVQNAQRPDPKKLWDVRGTTSRDETRRAIAKLLARECCDVRRGGSSRGAAATGSSPAAFYVTKRRRAQDWLGVTDDQLRALVRDFAVADGRCGSGHGRKPPRERRPLMNDTTHASKDATSDRRNALVASEDANDSATQNAFEVLNTEDLDDGRS